MRLSTGVFEISARIESGAHMTLQSSSQLNLSLTRPAKTDLVVLTYEMKQLMVTYSRAIEACDTIPQISISLLVSYLRSILWFFCLEIIVVFLGPLNIALWIGRRALGRPHVVYGRRVFEYFLQPFRSTWCGEIPAFKCLRLRYLTRLLLFYRATYVMNTLYRVYNRRHLELLVGRSAGDETPDESGSFQKTFELFQKITSDSYKFEALALGGPLIALLSFALQKVAGYFWDALGSRSLLTSVDTISGIAAFGIVFAILALWTFVTAWMDLRSIFSALGVHEFEQRALATVGLRAGNEIPFDLLFYFFFVALWYANGVAVILFDARAPAPDELVNKLRIATYTEIGFLITVLTTFGVIAAARRFHLVRRGSSGISAYLPAHNS